MATHPRAIKPKYGKAFKDLTPRTQREWTKRFAEADAAGITTASSTIQFYLEQKNNYWLPRATKLAEKISDPRYKNNLPTTDNEAKNYVLSGGPFNRSRTEKQMEHWGKYNNTLRQRVRNEARAQNRKIVSRKELDEYLGPSS